MKKGFLIVFTGIDGSGKTTQAELLVKFLKNDGIKTLYVWSRWKPLFLGPLIKGWKSKSTDEVVNLNYKSDLKEKKQRLLSNPIFRWLWLTGFLVDYSLQIFVKVRLKLLKKQLIVSDRIFYDSVIDQAINLGERKELLLANLDSFWIKVFFPKPDLVIYIDCPEDIAFTRNMIKNDTPNIEYLTERRELYLKLADKYRWIKIDGTLPVDEITTQVCDIVYKKLGI